MDIFSLDSLFSFLFGEEEKFLVLFFFVFRGRRGRCFGGFIFSNRTFKVFFFRKRGRFFKSG